MEARKKSCASAERKVMSTVYSISSKKYPSGMQEVAEHSQMKEN